MDATVSEQLDSAAPSKAPKKKDLQVAVTTKCGVYVTGINKRVTRDVLMSFFSTCGRIEECTFSESPRRGFAWIRFEDQSSADMAVMRLHHTLLLGTVVAVRPELGLNAAGDRVASLEHGTSACAPRHIVVLEKGPGKRTVPAVTYSDGGLLVGNVCYPIPQGVYLLKLLLQCHSSKRNLHQGVIDLLLDTRHGNKQAKELSESMAMVNAIPECGHRSGIELSRCPHVRVFVVGDGVVPYTALVMSMFVPETWHFVSIDPLMAFDTSVLEASLAKRITCVPSLSQDVVITPDLGWPASSCGAALASNADSSSLGKGVASSVSPDVTSGLAAPSESSLKAASSAERGSTSTDPLSQEGGIPGQDDTGTAASACAPLPQLPAPGSRRLGSAAAPLNIVVACHSHAPLEEFWLRVPSPKYAISLPCCGTDWSLLSIPELHSYEDYEIFSPKRRVHCYFQP